MQEKINVIDCGRCKKSQVCINILVSIGFSAFIFFISFVLFLNFSYMGAKNEEIETFIFKNFKSLLLSINLKILLGYIIIGLIIGLFSLLLKIEKKRYILLFNFFVWFMFWIRAVKFFPKLFAESLFRKGGLLKYFQVIVTDFTPLWLIYLIFIAVIIAISIKNKRVIYALPILLLCLLLVVKFKVTPVRAHENNPGPGRPNVLILATDSLRPQSISYNGYHRKTPNIDGVFAKGVSFLNAKSSLARTLPSWTSVFTSSFPPDHNMRHMFPSIKDTKKNWVTIIDVFNQHNYYTAVISDVAGDFFPNIDYGFQEVIAPQIRVQEILRQRSLEIHSFLMGFIINPVGWTFFPEMWGMTLNKDPWYVTEYTKKSIKKALKKKTPFFILYFSSNNHFPYVTKYPYYKQYTPKNYYGRHKYGLSGDILESFLETKVRKNEIPLVVNHYDSATKLFDDNVGEMLTFLEKCNIEKNTIVIIMSDHGESLYEENNGVAHGDHLMGPYSNSMVFGIYSPFEDFKGLRVEKTVRDIDVAPTILDLLNMPIPECFRGHSLVPVMRGKEFAGYPAYMETGLWYSTTTPFIDNKIRILYPNIVQILNIEMPSGQIAVKKEYEHLVVESKYRAYQLNERKYIYMPGETEYKEYFYINEKQVDKNDITDEEFLSFKQKMVDLFPGKLIIDEKGFIHERFIN
ncbi:MAG: sulfatase-like hydrolase/transferase [Candidatus Aminicenantes bacterium]|nr:sulfatase-like hydrolase/transferase [Candidatus Aminicenantes bacterium]NIM85026.1 sulfatase-like hydrolase/transferase [Candidatus Aminicenantes bacterium]NIN24540.1 sulfatase-like hydrolase/transferase [Candidatus Aminicenantes bacterium]NIN48304.1 sulfatase-like hydrolase/transferase [Candidatus Aminicenantes bacterium]NIN91207.1 sulfatase-like hydrolase/transferase [Candidatus Aminicenantes bacterium]